MPVSGIRGPTHKRGNKPAIAWAEPARSVIPDVLEMDQGSWFSGPKRRLDAIQATADPGE